MENERILFMVKPDGVKKGLSGECIKRVEKAGMKFVAMKMLLPTKEQAEKHYPNEVDNKDWFLGVARKAKKAYEEKGMEWEYDDDMDYGRMIKSFLIDYITSGPVVAAVVEGPGAIKTIRELAGNTEPRQAKPGTIRGDFGDDSYEKANNEKRSLYNIVHASTSVEEAEKEIKVWFTEDELVEYERE
jgi:nucleoside-diphosphate kinase